MKSFKITKLVLAFILSSTVISCTVDEPIQESLTYKVSETMETKTVEISTQKAGILQSNAASYNCMVLEVGLIKTGARITIQGLKVDLDALFLLIEDTEVNKL